MLGVVITKELNVPQIQFAIFVDDKLPLLFIGRKNEVNRRALTKEQIKALEKQERSKALIFGDWVDFTEQEVEQGFIINYRKALPLAESRTCGNNMQFQTLCVFSHGPNVKEPKCYTELFGYAKIDNDVVSCFLNDVAYRCWITVEVSRITTLDRTFGEVIDVAEEQTFVSQVPWNLNDSRFVVTIMDDSDSGSEVEEDWFHHRDVRNSVGLVTGERTVYSSQLADCSILLGIIRRENKFAYAGNYISFDAFYCKPLDAYVIHRMHRINNASPIKCKFHQFGMLSLLDVSIKSVPHLPLGYFQSANNKLGIVHDPENILLPLLLAGNAHREFRVYVVDTGPNRFSRFGIKDLSESAVISVNKAMADGYDDLENIYGLIIGNGLVLAPDYISLLIQFDENSHEGWIELPAGSWILFTAQSSSGAPNFKISKWKPSKDPYLVCVETVFTRNKFVFKAQGLLDESIGALKTKYFGLIELTRVQEKQLMPPNKQKMLVSVWVCEADNYSRSRFKLYSLSKPAVEEFVPEESINPNLEVSQITERASCQESQKCKHEDCIGHNLLRHCFNNRSIVGSFAESNAEDLLVRIVNHLLVQ